jgi:S-adenosylmethionine:tRNA ribosyltransferase-isomerase
MRVDDLDYELPPDLIAQSPAAERSASRLLHYCRMDGSIAHRAFSDLPSLLKADDLLVMNDARVTPARFTLVKPTGGRVEGLFVEQRSPTRAHVMLKNLGPAKSEVWLAFERDPSTQLRVIDRLEGGLLEVEIRGDRPLTEVLAAIGRMPLPPYIRRERGEDERDTVDAARYQTVYAQTPGSIAAPTAGLHFTPEVFAALDVRGIERARVTLHVGLGTFKPIEVDDLDQHPMHVERYELSAAACDVINAAKSTGRRIVAVGTTTARVLESQPAGPLAAHTGETRLLIRPPYAWKHVGALVTNFHQPRSTLIALVAAFMGLDEQRRVYREAIEHRYRFFSYGDAMLVE